MGRRHVTVLILLGCLVWLLSASSALAAQATYSNTRTISAPPASVFAGNSAGDGWGLALSSTQVFYVVHHNTTLKVACDEQTNASNCWSTDPKTITDRSGNGFATSGHAGMYLDQRTGKLYLYATRTSDNTGGVVCIDTTQPASNPDPFCGFTALSDVGDAYSSSLSYISMPMHVGSKLYAFNYYPDSTPGGGSGTENELMCFDLHTHAGCTGQPYAVRIKPEGDTGPGTVTGTYPEPAVAAIGSHMIIPITVDGTDELACFNASTNRNCAGHWPVTTNVAGYPGQNGAPFPMLDKTGRLMGFCLPTGADPCFKFNGSSAATPPNMASVIGASQTWEGPGLTIGPRVYVPIDTGLTSDSVQCFDYSRDAECPHFPFVLHNTYLIYTVNRDPRRPTCLWVNSDAAGGTDSGEIQNFDAYTGGACGKPPTRVLASQFIAQSPACTPASYDSIQVLKPTPGAYTSGTVEFEDGDGNPIPGLPVKHLDSHGSISLRGLSLNTSTGPPQFLVTLNGAPGRTPVEVRLIWSGDASSKCEPPGGHILTDHLTVGHVTVSRATASVPLRCAGVASNGCDTTLTLKATDPADTLHVVTVGNTSAALAEGQSKTVNVTLNRTGKQLLGKRKSLEAKLVVTLLGRVVARRFLTFQMR